jgi:MerR family transcriptional regulator, copper efflux regulator
MSVDLKIKDVADASGFTTATLRYYEKIGLLPVASRTAAGYRLYDERALDRLAFIARAKQLGCTLEEITGLTAAWDGGRCGPVQDQLRNLVAGKITAAEERLAELTKFMSELRHAAVALERHRPDGACDSRCGCVPDPVEGERTTSTKVLDGGPAIACTLSAGAMQGRIDAWQALLGHVERRQKIDGGVRCLFAASVPTGELIRLVAAEQDCCQFFQFAITVDGRGVALEVRAPEDARSIVESMFGVPA